MPSNNDPSVVQPGPGKLAAGQVPASALAFPFSGSGDLAAHIGDPIDAHMASAIGVPETDPNSGSPLLGSAGGPYDGESVSDALAALAQLFPARPDRIGYDNLNIPNDGVPYWNNVLTVGEDAYHGGWTDGGVGVVTKYVSVNTDTSVSLSGTLYPADRGVLALYSTTDGDFTNAAQTTLIAAIWLAQNPPPPGIPGSAFDELTRSTGQTDYTASNSGIDWISLADRFPYLANYPGSEYSPYGQDFSLYQLAKFNIPYTIAAAGDADSFLLVHWREQYANTLTAIQPAGLAASFTADNLYSASSGPEYENVERLNVYKTSVIAPTPTAVTTTPAGTLTTQLVSGIEYYDSPSFAVDVVGVCGDLFDGYYTNTVASASVPVGFEAPYPIVQGDLSQFGGPLVDYQLYDEGTPTILNHGTALDYSLGSPPAIGQTARLTQTGLVVAGASRFTYWPYSNYLALWRNPGSTAATGTSDLNILYNTWDTANALTDNKQTETQDHFVLEDYRHINSFGATWAGTSLLPSGGDIYDSTAKLVADDGGLQCHGGRLIYPSVDFSAAAIRPVQAGGSDYAAVQAGDSANHKRRWVRAFNTGIARNTGRIRIKINQPGPQTNLFLSQFAGSPVIDPAEVTDHAGGMIIQIKVPQQSGWLDLGRANGVPDLVKSSDFRGCRTAVSGDSTPEMIFSYDTQFFTADNGSGEYLLFVRVTIINPNTNIYLDEIEWLPP